MQTHIKASIKQVLGDRTLTTALIAFLVLCIGYSLYTIVNIHPIDLTVGVHYSSFGETFYYRERWYYLISFIGFGLVLGVVHTVLAVKLFLQERRQLALLFIYLSMFIVVLAVLLTRSVLMVAYPS